QTVSFDHLLVFAEESGTLQCIAPESNASICVEMTPLCQRVLSVEYPQLAIAGDFEAITRNSVVLETTAPLLVVPLQTAARRGLAIFVRIDSTQPFSQVDAAALLTFVPLCSAVLDVRDDGTDGAHANELELALKALRQNERRLVQNVDVL